MIGKACDMTQIITEIMQGKEVTERGLESMKFWAKRKFWAVFTAAVNY